MGKVWVVGVGPGEPAQMTGRALAALEEADVLCGYTAYLDLVRGLFPGKEEFSTPMRGELERCRRAVALARAGRRVAVVCSGDAGVYGMAGLVLQVAAGELAEDAAPGPGAAPAGGQAPGGGAVEVEVVPGVTAALSGAAVLGAPLGHDFCCVSLSDLLTPWEAIERRLEAAAEADFCIALYNPASRRRQGHLARACEALLRHRSAGTVCAWVRDIGRPGQESRVLTLGELAGERLDMDTTVFVGSSATRVVGGRVVTPRGYEARAAADAARAAGAPQAPQPAGAPRRLRVLVFGGTSEGRELAERLAADEGCEALVSVATAVGAEELARAERASGGRVRSRVGRLGEDGVAGLARGFDVCVDATHPYAREVTRNVRAGCARAGVPVLRVARPGGAAGDAGAAEGRALAAASCAEAAALLAGEEGRVLLTVGSKELAAFAALGPERLFARVLPTHEALDACEAAGLPHSHVAAMQGPFSVEMNLAHLAWCGASWLVTKDGGAAGGFPEKLEAARRSGARAVVIGRPVEEEGLALEEAWEAVQAMKAGAGGGAGGEGA